MLFSLWPTPHRCPRPTLPRRLANRCRAILGLVLLAWLSMAQADALRLDALTTAPLGRSAQLLVEQDQPLSLAQALAAQRRGEFQASRQSVPGFGIGAAPVWLYLAVDNPGNTPLPLQVRLGKTWIDQLDIYLLQNERLLLQQAAGDAAGRQRASPGNGFVITHSFAPGRTELLVRAQTPDPLLLPLYLLSPHQAAAAERWQHYGYGLLYGFLLALIAYNAMLYVGLRERSHLDYSLYLGTFVLLNLAYTGHGYAWLWPDAPGLQRYVILISMVLFSCSGLHFARYFLDLPRHAPRLAHGIRLGAMATVVLMALAVLLDWQAAAAHLAFYTSLLFTLAMVIMGLVTVQQGHMAGRYFLTAACLAMFGAAVTSLSVWGLLPYSELAYHAVELGVMAEATLLALALAYRVRVHQQARLRAEQMARVDPLTGLLNRRAFLESGEAAWSHAQRHHRPLSAILLDLDHFKLINDSHGHAAGDLVLIEAAKILTLSRRQGDLIGRWGGEEFILLLPETGLMQARNLAERLRQQIATLNLQNADQYLSLRASLGVTEQSQHTSLQALIDDADTWLYQAKQGGRNQVCGPSDLLRGHPAH